MRRDRRSRQRLRERGFDQNPCVADGRQKMPNLSGVPGLVRRGRSILRKRVGGTCSQNRGAHPASQEISPIHKNPFAVEIDSSRALTPRYRLGRRFDLQDHSGILIGEDIQVSVGTLAHVPNPLP